MVCLAVEQEVTACTSRNVVSRIEGTDKKDEILTITAHYIRCRRTGGPMIICPGRRLSWSFADIFSSTDLRRTMSLVWFGAEEKGLLGSRDYIRVHESELGAHRF